MKKIDILNYITDFRKTPNNTRTHAELLAHLGSERESEIEQLLSELKQTKLVIEGEQDGQRTFRVVVR